ncbi:secondary thiamine-phosphate synthase enzyme YjbQ [Halobacteriovorax marinus]|uniref:secondary thiamine-phosphate synthase enzyme YjbQ n=1 Tax=Halobacteriovorax marinus TaxID=97084 RepID=UPI001C12B7A7|nr:secondary thiamine-phosphate synthase enzyme YjbQ [Halobacteriovorax marinus]
MNPTTPSARGDLESFLDHIAPRNLPFIKHTDEGEDDSPSHMKTLLVNQSMSFIVDSGELILGTWQGIYLCEFRDSPKQRNILIKFVAD